MRKDISPATKMFGSIIIGCCILMFALTACSTTHGVVLSNAADSAATVFHEYHANRQKALNHTYIYDILPGRKVQTIDLFDKRISITIGGKKKEFGPAKVPASFLYTVDTFGFFKEQLVNATIKKDGCIYLLPPVKDGSVDAPQPKDFPHCPDPEPDVPPPELPGVSEKSRQFVSHIQTLSEQMLQWSCRSPVGGERIRPLTNLDPEDITSLRIARERIELLRRRSNGDWDTAASTFLEVQSNFDRDYKAPFDYKIFRLKSFMGDGFSGALGDYNGITDAYNTYMGEYNGYCGVRSRWIQVMLADEPALSSLRKKSHKPWLQNKNQLPCAVAAVQPCRSIR